VSSLLSLGGGSTKLASAAIVVGLALATWTAQGCHRGAAPTSAPVAPSPKTHTEASPAGTSGAAHQASHSPSAEPAPPSADTNEATPPLPAPCENQLADEEAQRLATGMLAKLRTHIREPRLELVGRVEAADGCGTSFAVVGVEAWRSPVWDEVYTPGEGRQLAELIVRDDESVLWRQDDLVIPVADVPSRLDAAAKAIRRVRNLPDMRELCLSSSMSCDFTVHGMHPADCAAPAEDRMTCAWQVDVSLIHERMQRYATFYVRDQGATFVEPAMREGDTPLTLEEWQRGD